MAIQLNSGGDYWELTYLQIDFIRKSATVSLSLFKNASSKSSGSPEILCKQYSFSGESFPYRQDLMPMDIIKKSYEIVSNHPDFIGATVVPDASAVIVQ